MPITYHNHSSTCPQIHRGEIIRGKQTYCFLICVTMVIGITWVERWRSLRRWPHPPTDPERLVCTATWLCFTRIRWGSRSPFVSTYSFSMEIGALSTTSSNMASTTGSNCSLLCNFRSPKLASQCAWVVLVLGRSQSLATFFFDI